MTPTGGVELEEACVVALNQGRVGPGEWIGVRGEHVLAVLPPQATDVAARLWLTLDDGGDFDAALDVVLRQGLGAVPSLVLLDSGSAGNVRLLVRGTPVVRLVLEDGESVSLDAGGGTWREERWESVRGVEVECHVGAGEPSEPLVPGLRRLGALVLGDVEAADETFLPAGAHPGEEPQEPHPAPEDVPVEREPEPAFESEPEPEPEVEPETGPEVEPETGPEEDGQGDADDRPRAIPVLLKPAAPEPDEETAPIAAAPFVPDPSPVPEVGPETGGGPIPEFPPAAATPPLPPVPPVPPVPATFPAWQEDVTSQMPSVDVPGLADLGLATPAQGTPTAVVPPTGVDAGPGTGKHTRVQRPLRATFSHGLVVELDRPYVVGRAPTLRATQVGARTVAVPSPLGEVSATHVELRPGTGPDTGKVMVVDLGSTNGTIVLRSGQAPVELLPGSPLAVDADAVVDLGDGASITLSRP